MSYLDSMKWKGICDHSEKCDQADCYHKEKHEHHVWGSKFAGGPWSCVQQKHSCPHGETDYHIICNRIDNKKIHLTEKSK